MNKLEEKIFNLANELAATMGINVVAVEFSRAKIPVLRIDLETIQLTPVNIDECSKFSRELAIILDINEVINSKYTLEVGSPGVNRKLHNLSDYDRFKDSKIKLKTRQPVDSQKSFKAVLKGIEQDKVIIELKNQEIKIDFDNIEKARLDII